MLWILSTGLLRARSSPRSNACPLRRLGHLAMLDWHSSKLMCELQVGLGVDGAVQGSAHGGVPCLGTPGPCHPHDRDLLCMTCPSPRCGRWCTTRASCTTRPSSQRRRRSGWGEMVMAPLLGRLCGALCGRRAWLRGAGHMREPCPCLHLSALSMKTIA